MHLLRAAARRRALMLHPLLLPLLLLLALAQHAGAAAGTYEDPEILPCSLPYSKNLDFTQGWGESNGSSIASSGASHCLRLNIPGCISHHACRVLVLYHLDGLGADLHGHPLAPAAASLTSTAVQLRCMRC